MGCSLSVFSLFELIHQTNARQLASLKKGYIIPLIKVSKEKRTISAGLPTALMLSVLRSEMLKSGVYFYQIRAGDFKVSLLNHRGTSRARYITLLFFMYLGQHAQNSF